MSFVPTTNADRAAMLKTIGLNSIEELFADIPEAKRFPKLDLPPSLSELEITRELTALQAKNLDASSTAFFLGAGAYQHFVPSIVNALSSRGEFLTAYTPYQPEVSQGTLQAIFEYQSMVAKLFGVEVVNASHFDGATALAEAALMAYRNANGTRNELLISSGLHPEYKEVLTTYLQTFPITIKVYSGDPANAGAGANTCCVIASYPEFSGELYTLTAAAEAAHQAGALFIVHTDPLACAILKSPGECGADIVVAEGQSLGNYLNYGGPYLGMMGTSEKLVRRFPGRIVGQALDRNGQRGFVLTLSAREQHIRREKAVSNICSNQGLIMLRTCIYLAAMGKNGLTHVARLCWDKAHYAAELIAKIGGYKIVNKNFFMEFTVLTPVPATEIVELLKKRGIVAGLALAHYDPKKTHELLVCVTEMATKNQIELLAASLTEVLAKL